MSRRSGRPGGAVELLAPRPAGLPLVLLCEHASNRLPPPLCASPADLPWMGTHRAWDLGAAALTRALSALTGAGAVLARFSRLACDPNRDPSHPEWVLREVGGHGLSFNRRVDRQRRLRLHRAYHRAAEELVEAVGRRRPLLLSVHSFTPVLDGRRREMSAGVLFGACEEEARRLAAALRRSWPQVALNEPYSGLGGMIHSVESHGLRRGLPHLEIEVRNDLLAGPDGITAAAEVLADALVRAFFRRFTEP